MHRTALLAKQTIASQQEHYWGTVVANNGATGTYELVTTTAPQAKSEPLEISPPPWREIGVAQP